MSMSKFSPPHPPIPYHHFATSISDVTWHNIDAAVVPVWDKASRPFWTRTNSYMPYVTPLCSACQSALRDMTIYSVSPTITADHIPSTIGCRCFDYRPGTNVGLYRVPTPDERKYPFTKKVFKAYENLPTVFLPLPTSSSPTVGIDDDFPVGKTLYLGDREGMPTFDDNNSLFPPQGAMDYVSSLKQFVAWTTPFHPHDRPLSIPDFQEALARIFDFVNSNTRASHALSNGVSSPFLNRQAKLYYLDTIPARINSLQVIYSALSLDLGFLMNTNRQFYKLVRRLEDAVPLQWKLCPAYLDFKVPEYHRSYIPTVDSTFKSLLHTLDYFCNTHLRPKQFLDAEGLKVDFRRVAESFPNNPVADIHDSNPLVLLDELTSQLHAEALKVTARVLHFSNRVFRSFFFLSHAYASALHALEDPTLQPITKGVERCNPFEFLKEPEPSEVPWELNTPDPPAVRHCNPVLRESKRAKQSARASSKPSNQASSQSKPTAAEDVEESLSPFEFKSLLQPEFEPNQEAVQLMNDAPIHFNKEQVDADTASTSKQSEVSSSDEDSAISRPSFIIRAPKTFSKSSSRRYQAHIARMKDVTSDVVHDSVDVERKKKKQVTAPKESGLANANDLDSLFMESLTLIAEGKEIPKNLQKKAMVELARRKHSSSVQPPVDVTETDDTDVDLDGSVLYDVCSSRNVQNIDIGSKNDDSTTNKPFSHAQAQRDMDISEGPPAYVVPPYNPSAPPASQRPMTPPLSYLVKEDELTNGIMDNQGKCTLRHPWIRFNRFHLWEFCSNTMFPVSIPVQVLDSNLNSSYPMLPSAPPPSFKPELHQELRAEAWTDVRKSLGPMTSLPHKVESPLELSMLNKIREEADKTDEFQRSCWILERARRPVLQSSEPRYRFAEDWYPLALPDDLTDARKNPYYPFLPPEPPKEYRPKHAERLDSWARLCTRFGSCFNRDNLECNTAYLCEIAYINYRRFVSNRAVDPFTPPTSYTDLYIPIASNWVFDVSGLPIGIPADYSSGRSHDPPPRPIPISFPEQFRRDLPTKRRINLWRAMIPMLERLQALGFPRRYDLLKMVLHQHDEVKADLMEQSPPLETYRSCYPKKTSWKKIPRNYNGPRNSQPYSIPYFEDQDQIPQVKPTLHRRPLQKPCLCMYKSMSCPTHHKKANESSLRRRRHPRATLHIQQPADNSKPSPTKLRVPFYKYSTIMNMIVILLLALPLVSSTSNSVIIRNRFIFESMRPNTHINPTYHTIARRIDINDVPSHLAAANHMLDQQQYICRGVVDTGAFRFLSTIAQPNETDIDPTFASNTCRDREQMLPAPDTKLGFDYLIKYFRSSTIMQAWIKISLTEGVIRAGASLIEFPVCQELEEFMLRNKTASLDFLVLKYINMKVVLCYPFIKHSIKESRVMCTIPHPSFTPGSELPGLFADACRRSLQTSEAQISRAMIKFKQYSEDMELHSMVYADSDGYLHVNRTKPVKSPSRKKRALPLLAGLVGLFGLGAGVAGTALGVVNIANDIALNNAVKDIASQVRDLHLADKYMASRMDAHIDVFNKMSSHLAQYTNELNHAILLNYLSDTISDLTQDCINMMTTLSAIIAAAGSNVVYPTVLTSKMILQLSNGFHAKYSKSLVKDTSTYQIQMARDNHAYYAIMRIPIFDQSRMATIFNVHPIPIWVNNTRLRPAHASRHVAIFNEGFSYVDMSVDEYQTCLTPSNPCVVHQPVANKNFKNCGAVNFHTSIDQCEYEKDRVQEDYFALFGNRTVYSVNKPQFLHVKCSSTSNLRSPSFSKKYHIYNIGSLSFKPHCIVTTAAGKTILVSEPNLNEIEEIETYVINGGTPDSPEYNFLPSTLNDSIDISAYLDKADVLENLPKLSKTNPKSAFNNFWSTVTILLLALIICAYIFASKCMRTRARNMNYLRAHMADRFVPPDRDLPPPPPPLTPQLEMRTFSTNKNAAKPIIKEQLEEFPYQTLQATAKPPGILKLPDDNPPPVPFPPNTVSEQTMPLLNQQQKHVTIVQPTTSTATAATAIYPEID